MRYESLQGSAEPIVAALGCDGARVADALSSFHRESVERWRNELSAEQLADVEAEAGDLLTELGYTLDR